MSIGDEVRELILAGASAYELRQKALQQGMVSLRHSGLEKIRGGDQIATYSKKAQSALAREYRKMFRNLNGIRTLNRMPECLVIVDPNKEKNAIKEARSLGITTVALIDTDCDPDLVDLPIPGNDDGIRSIELIMRHLAEAVLVGSQSAAAMKQKGDRPAAQPEMATAGAAEAKEGNV